MNWPIRNNLDQMKIEDLEKYKHIRSGGSGFYEQKRGLIAVWGKESVQFLDGLISNDMKTLSDGGEMLAAFPNAQGRLLAVVRVLRQGERFLFETEAATREKVFTNLFRFTFAGDFFVEDMSENYSYFELFNLSEPPTSAGGVNFGCDSTFVEKDNAADFRQQLIAAEAVEVSDDLYEILRIESRIPKYGVDMDETTIVPELGLDGLISYNKGCYIGQEIIARIHFRGHVAKRFTGLLLSTMVDPGTELLTADGKNAGRVTSTVYSPKLERAIALGYVRYDYLGEGTELLTGTKAATVTSLPFI